ncbi:hypothetical protein G647_08243 [Cladophialophora carrionii CBS 160.54]|uniref:Scytalone dehydratase-like domain-containing protein n=1 Tax=Cladophialophora carrionii CBS 160.54 TaxID=1279043 RepID=V9CZX4_9EURO|nr:uncharacterized protein G647_08243 [Cladophialophora carrionii CBS 160.54]ETI20209.1 hypothetical protein G647_08243 [Cladophialophora carrionii CBS 160.54]
MGSISSMPPIGKERITFEEWLDCSGVLYDWADCYDNKNWYGLMDIIAPKLTIDYDKVNNAKFTDLPSEKYIEMMADPLFLGDELISSQHLIGATKWEKVSDEEIVSHHQSRAAHQRFEDVRRKDVAVKGHGHGTVTTFYKKVDGRWKWAGIKTKVIWNEFDFEHVFRGVAGKE